MIEVVTDFGERVATLHSRAGLRQESSPNFLYHGCHSPWWCLAACCSRFILSLSLKTLKITSVYLAETAEAHILICRWWTLKASAHRTRMVRTHPTASTSRACESSSRQLHYSQTACAFADTGTLRVEACFLRTLSLSRLSVTPKLQQRKKERFSGRFPGTLGWGKVNEREEGREKRKAKTQRGRHDEGRKNGV